MIWIITSTQVTFSNIAFLFPTILSVVLISILKGLLDNLIMHLFQTKIADLEARRRFVQSYLSCTGNQPGDGEIDQLIDDVEKYTLPNHIFWGLWGLISGHVNHIDFNYIEYARQRFRQYWLTKPQLLEGKMACIPLLYILIHTIVEWA